MSVFHSIGLLIRAFFRDRAELAVENLALRQQLALLKEKTKRPKLRPRDRVFWVWLSRFWGNRPGKKWTIFGRVGDRAHTEFCVRISVETEPLIRGGQIAIVDPRPFGQGLFGKSHEPEPVKGSRVIVGDVLP